jgi:hypothetical protein
VGPRWFSSRLVADGFVRALADGVATLTSAIDDAFVKEARTLLSARQFIMAAAVAERGIETCDKASFHFSRLGSTAEALRTIQQVGGGSHIVLNLESRARGLKQLRESLVILFATASLQVTEAPHTSDMPDYFGHAYAITAEDCQRALNEGDESFFSLLFPLYMELVVAANARLRMQFEGRDPRTFALMTTESFYDALTLSGLALVYAELDGKKYAETVRQYWDQYLDQLVDSRAGHAFLLAIPDLHIGLFAMTPRDLERSGWEQSLQARLREHGLVESYGSRVHRRVRHESPLIRALGWSPMMSERPANVFLAMYLIRRPQCEGLEIPRWVRDLVDRVERESEREAGSYDTEEGDDE